MRGIFSDTVMSINVRESPSRQESFLSQGDVSRVTLRAKKKSEIDISRDSEQFAKTKYDLDQREERLVKSYRPTESRYIWYISRLAEHK